MPSETYRLPNLVALLPGKPGPYINPHYKEAKIAFNAWVEKRLDGPFAEEVYKCDTSLLTSLTCPLASYQQLRGILGHVSAAFLLDDTLDRIPREDIPAVAQSWLKILRDGSGPPNSPYPDFEIMHSELLLDTRDAVGPFHWPQFISANEEMVAHMARESMRDRELYLKDEILDVQSYLCSRRVTIGARPYFIFLRCTRCLYIPDDIMAHPAVQEMENAAKEIMIFSNDIHSFKKEYEFDGALTNIITIMQKDPRTAHLDLQERLNHAEELFKAALERFNTCSHSLPSFDPEMDQYLSQYVDGIIDLAIGNAEWGFLNRRYNTYENEEDRANHIMRLDVNGRGE